MHCRPAPLRILGEARRLRRAALPQACLRRGTRGAAVEGDREVRLVALEPSHARKLGELEKPDDAVVTGCRPEQAERQPRLARPWPMQSLAVQVARGGDPPTPDGRAQNTPTHRGGGGVSLGRAAASYCVDHAMCNGCALPQRSAHRRGGRAPRPAAAGALQPALRTRRWRARRRGRRCPSPPSRQACQCASLSSRRTRARPSPTPASDRPSSRCDDRRDDP
jgi:hypothetical protein